MHGSACRGNVTLNFSLRPQAQLDSAPLMLGSPCGNQHPFGARARLRRAQTQSLGQTASARIHRRPSQRALVLRL